MTHHLRTLSPLRAASAQQTPTRQGFASAAPTGIAAACNSTTLALSMMVALRYLEGRPSRSAADAARALPAPAAS